jgi:hypothetical protein
MQATPGTSPAEEGRSLLFNSLVSDSFAAGLTFALAEGRTPAEALAFGAKCGAACVTGRGPYEAQLRRDAGDK